MKKLVKESLNESPSKRDVLLKQREKAQKGLDKAKEDHKKARDRKEAFIEKYGEKAWDNNMRYYSDGYDAWKYEQMRYPGKAAWNGEGPIMRAQNDASNRQSRYEAELNRIDKLLQTVNNGDSPGKKYYGKWNTSNSKMEDTMMSNLQSIISEFVQKVGYGGDIKDKNHPGYGKYLRELDAEELAEKFLYMDELSKEQIEEVATAVFNREYLDAYRNDDGEWIFPEK